MPESRKIVKGRGGGVIIYMYVWQGDPRLIFSDNWVYYVILEIWIFEGWGQIESAEENRAMCIFRS